MSDVTVSLFVTHIFNINSGISAFISIRSCGDMNIPDFTYKLHCIPKILFSFFFFYGKDHSYITRIALRIRFTDNDVIIKYIYIYILSLRSSRQPIKNLKETRQLIEKI